ncbi:hypothetical protein LXJ57_25560, partial [Escherichia coli]|uniref:hypothetical protein n=1 Tax=Escherichia coli TaxID=562 RepID=UPI001E3AEF8E
LRMASVETILVVAAVLIAILLAFWGLRRQDAGSSGNEQRLILWSSAASSLVGAVIVLGLTGLWPHHAQILFVAEILVVVGIAYQLKPKSAVRPLTRIALLTLLA